MTASPESIAEHDLPGVEALIGATLALMTGYSQALQAAVHPAQRVVLGAKIGRHLALLVDHPRISTGMAEVLTALQRHWTAIIDCTDAAALECQHAGAPPPVPATDRVGAAFRLAAPARLQ